MKYILLSVLTLMVACVKKDGTTSSTFRIVNNSGVDIVILPTTSMVDTLRLPKSKSLDKFIGNSRGKNDGISLAYFADSYPVVTIFNNLDTIIHFNDTLPHFGNYYNLKSNRCFYNKTSYSREIKNESKYSQNVILNYVFTEQDYLDAQK